VPKAASKNSSQHEVAVCVGLRCKGSLPDMREALNEMCMIARNIDLAYVIHKLQRNTLFERRDTVRGGGSKTNRREKRFGDNARMVDECKFPCELAQVARISGLRPGPILDWRSQHLTGLDCDSTQTDFSCPKRSVPGRLQVLDSTCGKLMNRIAHNEMFPGSLGKKRRTQRARAYPRRPSDISLRT
jgi:hypothetical protein